MTNLETKTEAIFGTWFYIWSSALVIIQILLTIAVVYYVIKLYRKVIGYLDKNS